MDKYLSLVLDSLFLANKLIRLAHHNPSNDKLLRIAGKAWKRHWRRVKTAIEMGHTELKIPENAYD